MFLGCWWTGGDCSARRRTGESGHGRWGRGRRWRAWRCTTSIVHHHDGGVRRVVGRVVSGCGGRGGVGRGGEGGGGVGAGVRLLSVGEGRPPGAGRAGLRLVGDGRRAAGGGLWGMSVYVTGLAVRGFLARCPWPMRQRCPGAARSPGGPADERRGGSGGGGRAPGSRRRRDG